MGRNIAPVIRIKKLYEKDNDFAYWQSHSIQARITALEEIRREYHAWLRSIQGVENDAEPGFQRVFESLNDNHVQYLVVGGYALAAHGHPRYTKDLDV